MQYSSLISFNNLLLAWRRISTGRNVQYKRFFRPIYLAYEIAYEENLRLLHQRLKGGWKPSKPSRIYLPKPSGLQRPVTLIGLEDQIVLQLIANFFAVKLHERRRKVEHKLVFSNVLERPQGSIFFLEEWRNTYREFQTTCENYFRKDYRWIAHFDLAAYYDTISHSALVNIVAPRSSESETWVNVKAWLQCWSTPNKAKPVGHGIPQGPIASDFLAESMLLSLDEHFAEKNVGYVRYVDDIRIFAKTEIDAQCAAVELEIQCRNMGLIPQGKKYAISKAEKIEDAMGSLPSINPHPVAPEEEQEQLPQKEAEDLFREAIGGKPKRIEDKARARYVLYRAAKSQRVLSWALKLLPRHPEHIDAFMAYLRNYSRGRNIETVLLSILEAGTPYGYVRGEIYQLLARFKTTDTLSRVMGRAKDDLRDPNACLALKWGASSLLLSCQELGLCRFSKRIKTMPPLVQALLVPIIPDEEYGKAGIVASMLSDDSVIPGLVLVEEMFRRNHTLKNYGLRLKDVPDEVQNTLKGVGIIGRRFSQRIDQIGDILHARYRTKQTTSWRRLLGADYTHALQILIQADRVFLAGPSNWLMLQNSFNDAIHKALLTFLDQKSLPGGCGIHNRKGELIEFGVLLGATGTFSVNHPQIADCFREINNRRNRVPGAHPYDKKSGDQTSYLKGPERNKYAGLAGTAYGKIIDIVEANS